MLKPHDGSCVLDMCAAPGMKTIAIAGLMKNKGMLYAVEQNEERFKTLSSMIENYGVTCAKLYNKDVLTITKNDCPNVEYILVDPSCSGSGKHV